MVKIKLRGKGRKVLKEFKKGTLKTAQGTKPQSREQALAIAFSEQERADKRKKRK